MESRHSFSFASHYDAANTHHGVLLANNVDVLRPGTGFEDHPHHEMEIVTWVLDGSLVHRDSTGRCAILYPGAIQRMSAGTGIRHSEKNDSWRLTGAVPHGDPVRYVQMWVAPDEHARTPAYEQFEIGDGLRGAGLVPVASGLAVHAGAGAIRIGNRNAALYAARLEPGDSVLLPHAPFMHVFLARGSAELAEAGLLQEGDAVRLTATGGQRITASTPSEVLVWEMHAGLGY